MLYQSLQNSFSLDSLEQMRDMEVVRLFILLEQTAVVNRFTAISGSVEH